MSLEIRSAGQLELRSEEERILAGTVVPYGVEVRVGRYREQFARGAFADADPNAVPLMVSHRHADLPIGRTLTLADEHDGLHGEWKLSETQEADEVLSLARDGVPLSLSVGFAPDVDRWSRDRSRVTRVRSKLGEVSVVGVGQYPQATVTAVRSMTPRLDAARLLSRAPGAHAFAARTGVSGMSRPTQIRKRHN